MRRFGWIVASLLLGVAACKGSASDSADTGGSPRTCPTATGAITESSPVVPQTVLHLSADQSTAASGSVGSYRWSVVPPDGSASTFLPSGTVADPTFEADVAGTYEFDLEVYDDSGVQSCMPWSGTVDVVPDATIHVELLWHTPGDSNETDTGPNAGSDLDLHFALDASARTQPDLDGDGQPDPWFDPTYDCFWFDPHPTWGSSHPSLDRADSDGAGPENLNLPDPQDGLYDIGVHYWDDHGYGPSQATVRVYVNGTETWEKSGVQLNNHDMWNVGTLTWPGGTITPAQTDSGDPVITPDYVNPSFSGR